ncbi:MAG: calcium-binding protein [Gammaproteobacteria bacterium]
MLDGGSGADDLRAGPGPDDPLGGDGNDALRGGLGADLLDAGPGSGDEVVYLENAHENVRVIVSLDKTANDGIQGEKDNVLDSAEIVAGGTGPDTLSGNDGPNRLIGNVGDDVLIGNKGADVLDSGLGNDQLASNRLFGVPVEDSAIDTLDGGLGDSDRCRIPFVEPDVTTACELINKD